MRRSIGLALVVGCTVFPLRVSGSAAASVSPAKITPSMLMIPAGAFAPATMTGSYVDPNSNNLDKNLWPRNEHSVGYRSFGRVNGYYEKARWMPPGQAQTAKFEYDGSILRTAGGALRAWHDGSTHDFTFTGVRSGVCPTGLGNYCTRIFVPFNDKFVEYYDVIAVGRCLSEARVDVKQGLLRKKLNRLTTILSNIDRAAYNALSLSCQA